MQGYVLTMLKWMFSQFKVNISNQLIRPNILDMPDERRPRRIPKKQYHVIGRVSSIRPRL